MLLREPAPQSTLCFTCHDGTGALADVQADWTTRRCRPTTPRRRSYYSHPATTTSASTRLGTEDEFGGALNRHAECADCHQPHLADATSPSRARRLDRLGRDQGCARASP